MAKVVVLDVDGTLMDTNYLHTEAWARAFEEVGHRIPRARLHKQIGKGSSLLIREFVEDDTFGVLRLVLRETTQSPRDCGVNCGALAQALKEM